MERFIVLDTETTGFSPKNGDRVVELAAIEIIDRRLTGRVFHEIYWPQRDVPDRSAQVHGWTTQRLRGKPLFAQSAPNLIDFIQDAPIWAQNAPFDERFLRDEMERAGYAMPWTFHCSLRLAKKRLPHLPAHKLHHLVEWAKVQWKGTAHTALADTTALAEVLLHLLDAPEPMPRPKPQKQARATPRATKGKAPSIAPWTGPVAPGNDPRLAPPTAVVATPHQGKAWTNEEDHQLRHLFCTGFTLGDMTHEMGRSPAALALRLERQGLVGDDHPYAHFKKRS